MTPRIPSVADLAEYLGVTTSWARTNLADGTIKNARKVRGRWYVPLEDVDAWLDAGRPERTVDPTARPYRPYPRRMTNTVDP